MLHDIIIIPWVMNLVIKQESLLKKCAHNSFDKEKLCTNLGFQMKHN